MDQSKNGSVFSAVVGGGVAGLVTDVTLFPLDTLKTRLQGGEVRNYKNIQFKLQGLYQGLGPAAFAAAPAAGIFFGTYDFMKRRNYVENSPFGHGQAAAVGEVAACLFKVPFEVAKQRLQILQNQKNCSFTSILSSIYKSEGLRGCYAGLGATLAREIPFGFIQMPVYEFLRKRLFTRKDTAVALTGLEGCVCGAIAGGLAASLTCPIDVWKTRLMLGDKNATIFSIWRSEGISALFAGITPRVLWISLGGSLFFGVYEIVVSAYM